MAEKEAPIVLELADRAVPITSPSKPYFTQDATLTKLDIVTYFLEVADGALHGIRDRPIVLKRFVNGAEKKPFYQKRAPKSRPKWVRTVEIAFPSGRTANEVVVDEVAGLAWIVNLGCMELHPHAVRTADLVHPDELRIDLDPVPGVEWATVRQVALEVRGLLEDMDLIGWPKTSGSRGIHIAVRIEPRWPFTEVRRAALALSREIERRAPAIATSKWWKEERHGVFLDYNQNAKDRTTCAAYSVRPVSDARVSAPLTWDEVPDCDAADFTVQTMPARFQHLGHVHSDMEAAVGTLDGLLELADRDEADGLGDAPWPPHFRKQPGERTRVTPSRAKHPLLVIALSPDRDAAMAGLERWKGRHPDAAEHLEPADILIDKMRGRSSTWTRIRVNLRHVPDDLRPAQETPDPNADPTREWREGTGKRAGGNGAD